jgi:cell division protein FtsI (penicillin-binding protein 3)
VLAKSSNICTTKIAAREGKERMREMMLRFGFGRPTGVDLPGERAGDLAKISRMGPVETATTSFGQGMAATAMQLATAYAAIANGGTLYKPHVLRRVVDGDGKTSVESAPDGHRVIDPTLAGTLRTMLLAVTQKGGTAEKLSLPGYRFAGKTGTAQKVDPATRHYSNEKWASSFVGFAPLDDPRIVLYVVIDEPQGGHFGSLVAGPVFEEVVGDALRWLGVQPTEAAPHTPEPAKPPSARQLAQAPRATPALDALPASDDAEDRVPELRGLGIADVAARAAKLGVRLEVVGSGLAFEQSPAPGAALADGVLRVSFRPPS